MSVPDRAFEKKANTEQKEVATSLLFLKICIGSNLMTYVCVKLVKVLKFSN